MAAAQHIRTNIKTLFTLPLTLLLHFFADYAAFFFQRIRRKRTRPASTKPATIRHRLRQIVSGGVTSWEGGSGTTWGGSAGFADSCFSDSRFLI
jgi:hypothetical protein